MSSGAVSTCEAPAMSRKRDSNISGRPSAARLWRGVCLALRRGAVLRRSDVPPSRAVRRGSRHRASRRCVVVIRSDSVYGMPSTSIPWCNSGNIIDSSVDSCPPCIEVVEVKTAAGLPASAPESHCADVESMKCFSGAAMLPKRVGEPSASPPHSSRSRSSAYGAPSGGTLGSAVVDDGRHRRNGAQSCMRSVDLIDALRHRLGQQPSRAGARVVENQDVHALRVVCGS